MTPDPNSSPPGPQDTSPSVEAIEADIAQTREELADTVDQLTARLDVKARTKERIHQTSDQVTGKVADGLHALRVRAADQDGRPPRAALGVGGAVALVVVAVLAVIVWRRGR